MDIPRPKYGNKRYIHLKEWRKRIFYFTSLLIIGWNSTEVPTNMLANICLLLELSVFLAELYCAGSYREIKKPGEIFLIAIASLLMHLVAVLFQKSHFALPFALF